MAGLGLFSLTTEKAKSLAKEKIKKGELSEINEAKFVKDLMEKAKEAGSEIDKKVEKAVEKSLKKLNIPTRKDLDEIKRKLDDLAKEKTDKV